MSGVARQPPSPAPDLWLAAALYSACYSQRTPEVVVFELCYETTWGHGFFLFLPIEQW